MSFRTEADYRAAVARLDEHMTATHGRNMTADEIAFFNDIMGSIEAYEDRHPSVIRRPEKGPAVGPGATPTSASLAADSMRRELARNRIEPVAHADLTPLNPTDSVGLSTASMEREIRRAGLRRVA